MLGDAQIIVLIVLVQKALEAVYATWNTRRLLAQGATEAGRDFFPVVVVSHVAWLAAIFLVVPPDREYSLPLLAVYIALQLARYGVIAVLGGRWTLRIIVPPDGPLVTSGPYQFMAHPYVTLVMLETFLLPIVFDAWQIATVMTAVIGAVRYHQIVLEEAALEPLRAHGDAAGAPAAQ